MDQTTTKKHRTHRQVWLLRGWKATDAASAGHTLLLGGAIHKDLKINGTSIFCEGFLLLGVGWFWKLPKIVWIAASELDKNWKSYCHTIRCDGFCVTICSGWATNAHLSVAARSASSPGWSHHWITLRSSEIATSCYTLQLSASCENSLMRFGICLSLWGRVGNVTQIDEVPGARLCLCCYLSLHLEPRNPWWNDAEDSSASRRRRGLLRLQGLCRNNMFQMVWLQARLSMC